MNCRIPEHKNCGRSHGIHLSALDIGTVAIKMQKDLFSFMFLANGLFSNIDVLTLFRKLVSNLDDVADHVIAGFSFLKDHRIDHVTKVARDEIRRKLLTLHSCSSEEQLTCEVEKSLGLVEKCSCTILSLLKLVARAFRPWKENCASNNQELDFRTTKGHFYTT